MKNKNNRIGLALSGGGFRATIYHLGTFNKLKELGLLDKIDVISTNSGGSITGACYSLNYDNYNDFKTKLKEGVKKDLIKSIFYSYRFIVSLVVLIILFTARYWLFLQRFSIVFDVINIFIIIILFRFQFYLMPISKIIESKYNKYFFSNKKLKDLSSRVKLIINSTNVETGRIFHFSNDTMGDSTYSFESKILFNHRNFPISRSVMASSCVPFAFSPIKIDKEFYQHKKDFCKIKPKLIDGGVYDNQGIHKLTFSKSSSFCKYVIVSDAGNFLESSNWSFNQLLLLKRTSDIFMSRIKNIQMMMNLYMENTNSIVAYQSLGFDVCDSINEFIRMLKNNHIDKEVIRAHKIEGRLIENKDWDSIYQYLENKIGLKRIILNSCTLEEIRLARSVKTSLSPLSNNEIKALIKHAEVISEIQIKLYLPHILN